MSVASEKRLMTWVEVGKNEKMSDLPDLQARVCCVRKKASLAFIRRQPPDQTMATMATATGDDKWPAAAEKDLERVRELGRGNFGAVWLCKSKKAAQTKKTGDDKDLTAGYVAVKVRRLCVGTFEPCVRSLNHSLTALCLSLVHLL